MYEVRKVYPHSLGLSATFRQWKAESHCRFIHGYALKFVVVFRGTELDHRNWLVDFGGLKVLKNYLTDTFDHRTLVTNDDPHLDVFASLNEAGIIRMEAVENVGCEAFATMVYDWIATYMPKNIVKDLHRVECWEHDGNMAAFEGYDR